MWNHKKTLISQSNLEKVTKTGVIIAFNFKIHFKSIVIKWICTNIKPILANKTKQQRPQVNPHIYNQ